ncbi:unnamed protein product, partial [Symbiodinium sp. KB8]
MTPNLRSCLGSAQSASLTPCRQPPTLARLSCSSTRPLTTMASSARTTLLLDAPPASPASSRPSAGSPRTSPLRRTPAARLSTT